MNKNEAYFILISTFILVVVWIVFSILQSASNSTISEPLNAQISPITATFDMETISSLKERKEVIPLAQIDENQATSAADLSPTPTPTVTPSQAATNSATVNNANTL